MSPLYFVFAVPPPEGEAAELNRRNTGADTVVWKGKFLRYEFSAKKQKTYKKIWYNKRTASPEGPALPKPGRSLTAAIAARCAAKTWYNERSPRRAGVTCLAGTANAGV